MGYWENINSIKFVNTLIYPLPLIFDSMKTLSLGLTLIMLTCNTVCYGQKIKGDSLESNTYFDYTFETSTNKNNPLRSKYEHSIENQAQKEKGKFRQSGFFLYLDTNNILKNKDGILCHQLFLVNKTDSSMSFSDISIECEILDKTGKWKPKYNHLDSDFSPYQGFYCGSEMYQKYLSPNEYWGFKVPILKGIDKTKLRYRFMYEKAYIDFRTLEIDVYVNPEKLSKQLVEVTANEMQSLPPRYTKTSPRSVISLDRINLVYKGLNNPITVDVMDVNPKDICLKLSCGRALKDTSNPHYYYILLDSAYNDERDLTISVFTKNSFDSLELQGTHEYSIRPLPKPTLMLGSIENNGLCHLGLIRSASFVFANLKNFQYTGVKYMVKSYSILWTRTNGEKLTFEGEGPAIPIDIKRAFQFAKSGDSFTLKDVKVIGPLGVEEKLTETLTITAK